MSLSDLVIYALAVSHIIEVWHHGSIFAETRAWLELRRGFFRDLFLCMFCMSLWVSWSVVFLMEYPATYLIARWICYGLAVARTANLINDLTYHHCRTPGSFRESHEQSWDSPSSTPDKDD